MVMIVPRVSMPFHLVVRSNEALYVRKISRESDSEARRGLGKFDIHYLSLATMTTTIHAEL